MQPFNRHTGVAAPLLRDNIDTDAIIPSREITSVSKQGLAAGLFAHWRYRDPDTREPDPAFPLNQTGYANASILLVGDNFGCGSSREHAAWALVDYGIRAIVAEGFGSIFFTNCVGNGLLPVVLEGAEVRAIAERVSEDPQAHRVCIDLEKCSVSCGGLDYRFQLDEHQREMMQRGLDAIDMTLFHENRIQAFEDADRRNRPWVYEPVNG